MIAEGVKRVGVVIPGTVVGTGGTGGTKAVGKTGTGGTGGTKAVGKTGIGGTGGIKLVGATGRGGTEVNFGNDFR